MAAKSNRLKETWKTIVLAFKGFSDDKVAKLSASLAYTTVFSLGPLLIVIIFLCGLFFGQEAVQGSINNQLQGFIGKDAANYLQDIIKNAAISGKGSLAAIVGIVTLVIGATAVFAEIQDSINSIWGLKSKPKRNWLKIVKDRLLSFSIIVSLGFLLLVSLAVSTVVDALSRRLFAALPDVSVIVFYVINMAISLIITIGLFMAILKVLPDAKITWKDVLPGGITSSILFLLAKFGVAFYISSSKISSTYGAAGSLVILLVWVYFSALILYLGAEFTKAYAINRGRRIHPNNYAVAIKEVEVEKGNLAAVPSKK